MNSVITSCTLCKFDLLCIDFNLKYLHNIYSLKCPYGSGPNFDNIYYYACHLMTTVITSFFPCSIF